jgi:carbamoyl-phosphate synthase small subunit
LTNQQENIATNNFKLNQSGILVLENKQVFRGIGLGATGEAVAELCFNTSMTGYQEIITDPSYSDQIINFTFPHIGNVGTNLEDIESEKVWLKGVVFAKEITEPSNYRSLEKLNTWLKKNKVIGIAGVDTREITNLIRSKGSLKATIVNTSNFKSDKYYLNLCKKWPGLKGMELTEKVTTKKIYTWNDESLWSKTRGYQKNSKYDTHIVAIDFGMKKNILRNFSNLNSKVTIVPCSTTFEKIMSYKPDGVFLSNGPGDPAATGKIVNSTIQKLLNNKVPVFGICLGHQLLALALGCKTNKMHQGHRGANHPVKNLENQKVEITSQNHGFEVSKKSIKKNVKITHISLFDQSIEGISSTKSIAFSVQYHPESSPGPHDSNYLFKQFIELVKKNAQKKRH